MMTTRLHRAIPAALAATLLLAPMSAALAAAETVVRVAEAESSSRTLALGRGKSVVVELPRDAKDVLVVDPEVANAVVRSARRVFVVGVKPGQTNIVFFDVDGHQIASFDISVGFDTAALQGMLRRLIPNADIRVEQAGKAVVLSGTVANAADAAQAAEITGTFVGDNNSGSGDAAGAASSKASPKNVINRLTIRSKEQVMLKVVVAEVQRDVAKQFGVDLASAGLKYGTDIVVSNYTNVFGTLGKAIADGGLGLGGGSGMAATVGNSRGSLTAVVNAMEQAGVMRTLAEPTLTAISGEQAKFLAGGEFPVSTGRSCDDGVCTVDIDWKPFGVGLEFTPVVLSDGRISLRVGTEVSELSSDGAVAVAGTTVKSLRVRRASSTVELPSGGTIMMAGLIKEETKQTINGTPGLQNLPILGTLFRSRDFKSGQTELMIIVTPYVVNPVARSQLQTPDEGFAPASDPSTILLGRINRIYGIAGKVDPTRPYHGTYGFIID
jgi:pilus assembly protein CpaC